MTTEHSGAGDPGRTLELLWGVQGRPRRGPRPRLTVEEIVRAATALADAEGLDALSMRRIAERLGVAPMSIYTYVPGKSELIDLMLDRAYGELTPPPESTAGEGTARDRDRDRDRDEGTDDASGEGGQGRPPGWRRRLEHIARENWALFHRHPWMLQVVTARPPMGPNLLGKYEYELRAVDGLGLSDLEMDSVVALVNGFAESSARVSVHAAQAEQRTGMNDEEWWRATAPVLEKLIDLERYPLGSRVGTVAGREHGGAVGPGHAFEFGLRRVLDGIEVLIRSR
ncbi:TetR/AcrR family transcriptional regulator [Actinomadura viridis]|uniref:AcrR family transcriptional regulator n=1 Tax=Actinomadura viridis TaxID=58110 RepID=A0A931DGG6_9ACTN|nr:TetR/AcrR family transcriptional regulator [Actinomadura viridis]MBG6090704.1 AcrR family transcriptional regulator [Actinomadura viridis]